jgi:hypothetical protein
MRERWLPVVGYEGAYEVSDCGLVKSVDRVIGSESRGYYIKPGRLLKQQTSHDGYKAVHLCRNGTEVRRRVHVLVLAAFIGPKPFPEAEANHKDGQKANNALKNLEWCDKSYNQKHAIALGLSSPRIAEYMRGKEPWNKNHRKDCAECGEAKKLLAKDMCRNCYYRVRKRKILESRALYLSYQSLR